MDPTEDFDDSEMERLLGSVNDSPLDPRFRHHLLERTTQVIRRRRRFRKLGGLLGMAACYLAGLATMRLITASRPANEPGPLTQTPAQAVVSPGDNVPAVAEDFPRDRSTADLPATVLERLAEIAPDENFRDLYRQAGDRYMREPGDVAAALRCYRHALKFAPPQALVSGENDNWLFASLKQAKLEEFQHANNGGRFDALRSIR
jgi:hypothetical protein